MAIGSRGRTGERYLIGADNSLRNIDLVHMICKLVSEILDDGYDHTQLVTFVADRLGHDYRYATDPSKVMRELSWSPAMTVEQGLKLTVEWYLSNQNWLAAIADGSYRTYRLPAGAGKRTSG